MDYSWVSNLNSTLYQEKVVTDDLVNAKFLLLVLFESKKITLCSQQELLWFIALSSHINTKLVVNEVGLKIELKAISWDKLIYFHMNPLKKISQIENLFIIKKKN